MLKFQDDYTTSRYFVIDSFPLPVCKFGRARYCRSFHTDGMNYGKCHSKKDIRGKPVYRYAKQRDLLNILKAFKL